MFLLGLLSPLAATWRTSARSRSRGKSEDGSKKTSFTYNAERVLGSGALEVEMGMGWMGMVYVLVALNGRFDFLFVGGGVGGGGVLFG